MFSVALWPVNNLMKILIKPCCVFVTIIIHTEFEFMSWRVPTGTSLLTNSCALHKTKLTN